MQYVPISFKSDYSLLKSTLKIKDIIHYASSCGSNYVGLLDDNPYGMMDFYDKCNKAGLKCVFGMVVKIGDNKIYLYVKNYDGYLNLIKINDYIQEKNLSLDVLFKHNNGLIVVLPYENYNFFNRLRVAFQVYLGYKNKTELKNAIQITKSIVFMNEVMCFRKEDVNLLRVLYKIGNQSYDGSDNYILDGDEEDAASIDAFVSEIDFAFRLEEKHIPTFCKNPIESWRMLYTLAFKGLEKRLGTKEIPNIYRDRLVHELKVIKDMGFVDYFLIVYDYVKFSKKNGIYVGPGRGSAAGALVSYTLGITDIDPLKYDLLFERFLNPERVTMPDIDIDFEDTRRADVIEYVKNRYGERYVSLIIAYGTLAARAAVRDVAKAFSIEQNIVDKLCKMIDAKKSLKDNLVNTSIVDFVKEQGLEKIYKISMRLEGIKKNTTVHAAGVVISSVPLNSIIPTFKTSEGLIAGYSMEYLEMMGLLKMDFLALSNLNVIHRAVDSIKRKDAKFDLNKIPLNDAKTYKLLSSGDTDNIFQFETPGMRNFIKKLDPENFDDLISAVALFRPGPMKNIDEYIARRKGRIQVSYVHSDLKSILESTYGIIVYQEQIMQILSLMGGYSYAEADLIRRAMSKKKKEVMVEERERFIDRATKKGYGKRDCEEVYDLIVRFANYGFNKAHSVAYALIGYQMAYMKANYRDVYHVNTLNMNIGSNAKIKDVIEDAKNRGMRIVKPSIAKSDYQYKIDNDSIILPLTAIKNISTSTSKVIIDNQPYVDYFDFFRKVYGKGINRGNLELLIKAGALDDFGVSRSTLLDNIDSAETYMELISTLDESLVEKPALVESQREDEDVSEIELFGFYISGHPASKYQDKKRIKLKDIGSWMNRRVEVVGLVEKLKVINTKKGEKMAFLNLNDETGTAEAVVFPKNNHLLNELVEGELSRLSCTVNKRDEKMQLVVEEILKLS